MNSTPLEISESRYYFDLTPNLKLSSIFMIPGYPNIRIACDRMYINHIMSAFSLLISCGFKIPEYNFSMIDNTGFLTELPKPSILFHAHRMMRPHTSRYAKYYFDTIGNCSFANYIPDYSDVIWLNLPRVWQSFPDKLENRASLSRILVHELTHLHYDNDPGKNSNIYGLQSEIIAMHNENYLFNRILSKWISIFGENHTETKMILNERNKNLRDIIRYSHGNGFELHLSESRLQDTLPESNFEPPIYFDHR